jgi:hypothetical protein|tara:strand:- start:491 stop:775 length:285 start_codon:yes stop_codon:yes gene_type:complete
VVDLEEVALAVELELVFLEDLVVVEVDQVLVVVLEIKVVLVRLKETMVDLHQERLIQLVVEVVVLCKQDNQVVDQEILQDQEAQEHQTTLLGMQ